METMPERPVFGELSLYQAMAAALNSDSEWLGKAKDISTTMDFIYGEPHNRRFFMRFESGNIEEVRERNLDGPEDDAAFSITASPEDWKALLRGEVKPTVAMATGRMQVNGSQIYLLKHIKAFQYVLNVMTKLDPIYDA